jgi:hypothetical protein
MRTRYGKLAARASVVTSSLPVLVIFVRRDAASAVLEQCSVRTNAQIVGSQNGSA